MSVDDSVKDDRRIQIDFRRFEELFRLHHRRVYSMCFRMTGNSADAEDLTQEVFVQVFRKLDTFRGESAFKTWLYRITTNQVLMYFRKYRRRREQTTEDGEMPEHVVRRPNDFTSVPILDRIALREAIAKLAPGYQTVLILHDAEGLQHVEIADILGCSVGTTKSQLHKARMKLRRLLQKRIYDVRAARVSQPIHEGLDMLPPTPFVLSRFFPRPGQKRVQMKNSMPSEI